MHRQTQILLHGLATSAIALCFFPIGFNINIWFLLGFPLTMVLGYLDFEHRFMKDK